MSLGDLVESPSVVSNRKTKEKKIHGNQEASSHKSPFLTKVLSSRDIAREDAQESFVSASVRLWLSQS